MTGSLTPSTKPTARDVEVRHGARQQRLRAAVERLGMQDDVAGPGEGQDGRRDRRHAGGEQHAGLRALVDREPVLDDLAVGMVEARIDETGAGAFGWLLAPRGIVEEVAAFLGRAEHEGRGEEDRRLDRALRQHRVVAVAQHQGLGPEDVVADTGLGRTGRGHGVSPVGGYADATGYAKRPKPITSVLVHPNPCRRRGGCSDRDADRRSARRPRRCRRRAVPRRDRCRSRGR